MIPEFEYNVGDTDFATDRNSTVIEADESNIAINTPNVKQRVICSPYEHVRVLENYAPIAQDEARGLIICANPGPDSDSIKIYTTTDGISFTKIADRDDEPFASLASDLGASINLFSCRVMNDGSYLINAGKSTAWVSGTGNTKLYRSIDAGSTWTAVQDMKYGYLTAFSWSGIDGSRVVVGEYGPKGAGNTARQVFLSTDYGATWTLIKDLGNLENSHIHTCVFDPTNSDRLFLCVGDESDTRGILSLTFNGDTWDLATITEKFQPTNAIVRGNFIYFASDNSAQRAIVRYDPSTGDFKEILLTPITRSATGFSVADPLSTREFYFSIEKIGNFYYTVSKVASADTQSVGVFVSPDCENWTALERFSSTVGSGAYGFEYVAGAVNGNLFVSRADGTNQGEVLKVPSVRLLEVGMNSFATENHATVNNNDTFESAGENWSTEGSVSALTRSTDDPYEGAYSLKAVYDALSVSGKAIGPRIRAHLGYTPQDGDFVTMSAWVKIDNPNIRIHPRLKLYSATEDVHIDSVTYTARVAEVGEWIYMEQVVEILQTFVTEDFALMIEVLNSDAEVTNFYIDNVQYIVGTSPLSLRDFNRDEIADDMSIASMVGLGDEFTVSCVWRPETHIHNLLADVPICRLEGVGGGYLDVYWDQSDGKYYVTDGSTPIASTETVEPGLHDTVQVAIVGDSTGTIVYISDPLNGIVVLGDGSGSPLTSQPSVLKTAKNISTHGYGTFANIRGFNSKLTENEVSEVFNSLSDLILPGQSVSLRGRVNFG